MIRLTAPALVALLAALAAGGCTLPPGASGGGGDLRLIHEAMQQVEDSYVVPVKTDQLVNGAANAKPWSFIPGFSKINEAFNNAMTSAIEKKSDDPADVASKTKAAINSALNQ